MYYEISEKSYTRDKMIADMREGLEPLEVAHRKWQSILEGGEDFGHYSCACCETYYDKNDPKQCLNTCPLGGTEGCCGGDYSRWIRHQNSEHMHEYVSYAIRCPECEEIAQAVMDTIESKLEMMSILKQTG